MLITIKFTPVLVDIFLNTLHPDPEQKFADHTNK